MHTTKGFTLIELLIVIVIIGVLAAIAIPSYRDQVTKTRRTDGQAALMMAAQILERCYTEYNAYNNTACVIPTSSNESYYKLTSSNMSATTYILTATATGAQAGDDECTTLTLDQTNLKGATGSNTSVCW